MVSFPKNLESILICFMFWVFDLLSQILSIKFMIRSMNNFNKGLMKIL